MAIDYDQLSPARAANLIARSGRTRSFTRALQIWASRFGGQQLAGGDTVDGGSASTSSFGLVFDGGSASSSFDGVLLDGGAA